MQTAMSVKTRALNTLTYNQVEMETLLSRFLRTPQLTLEFVDEQGEQWTFTARRRCRLFVMAKTPFMKRYEEVFVTSK